MVQLQMRGRAVLIATAILLIALVGVWVAIPTAQAEPGLSQLDVAQAVRANCQVLLAKATTNGQRNRANTCIADQTVIINALTASPSPSPSPSLSPTPSPTPSSTSSSSPSPSPTPSPTGPSPGPVPLNCRVDPSVCGYPDADNTGVPTGITLSVVTGDVFVTTAGTFIDRKDIRGCVIVQAVGVTVRNSKITCLNWYPIDSTHGGAVTVEDSELSCGDTRGGGLSGSGITARRVDVHSCENGIPAHANVHVEDSWIHDLVPTSVAGAHSDGAQLFGGTNITLRHNTILVPGANAAITRHILSGPQSITIENNFLGGGSYTVYCPSGQPSFAMLGNRFADGMQAYGLSLDCNNPAVTWAGNFRDSNGTEVRP